MPCRSSKSGHALPQYVRGLTVLLPAQAWQKRGLRVRIHEQFAINRK
jgi:hypothetical protein